MSDVAPERPDTSDMIGVHNALRGALGSASDVIGGVDSGDAGRVEAVASYYDNVLAFLDVHHAGEDELLWPKLLERLPDHAPTIERIAAQHRLVEHGLARSRAAVAAWRDAPSEGSAAETIAAIGELDGVVVPHLAEEEREILPLAAEALTVQEWTEFPGHAMRNFQGDKLWLVMGLIRDQMTEEQKAAMLAAMPPPASEFWTSTGQGLYDGLMAQVRA